jgi:hypothetical protein
LEIAECELNIKIPVVIREAQSEFRNPQSEILKGSKCRGAKSDDQQMPEEAEIFIPQVQPLQTVRQGQGFYP